MKYNKNATTILLPDEKAKQEKTIISRPNTLFSRTHFLYITPPVAASVY